ncbi:ATP-binding protein [Stackebrandtia albiflava]|uniref:ATP-binding protein n=1 Tax=Stackebrandtia albiflava TaxID=406432 RepID=UPI00131581F6|nr:ATP-binding protein [Stackebrandtia albiflava]
MWTPVAVTLVAGAAMTVHLLANVDSPLLMPVGVAITVAGLAGVAISAVLARRKLAAVLEAGEREANRLGQQAGMYLDDIQYAAGEIAAGRPASANPLPAPAGGDGGPVSALAQRLYYQHQQTRQALQSLTAPPSPPPRVVEPEAVEPVPSIEPLSRDPQDDGWLKQLAGRMQSSAHRIIRSLDDLESGVEDPDVLKGLFAVDHLATISRRYADSLAVLGGAKSRRRWSQPVNLAEIIRSAMSETPKYSMVGLTRPIKGMLHGHVAADVIHLLAELIDNATKFSPPDKRVMVRVSDVSAGVAIEIEDAGLGMNAEDQHRINQMLETPDEVDRVALLNDGRIGLVVVAILAHRHRVAVQLRRSVYGGTQATVVLPATLLATVGTGAIEPVTAQIPVSAAPASPAAPAPRPAASGSARVRQVPTTGEGTATAEHLIVPVARQPFAEEPSRPPQPVQSAPSPVSKPALPQRQRQANLAPELRGDAEPRVSQIADSSLMSAFQSGFRQGSVAPTPGESDADRPDGRS